MIYYVDDKEYADYCIKQTKQTKQTYKEHLLRARQYRGSLKDGSAKPVGLAVEAESPEDAARINFLKMPESYHKYDTDYVVLDESGTVHHVLVSEKGHKVETKWVYKPIATILLGTKLNYVGDSISLGELLTKTGAFPSLTQIRKLVKQKGLRRIENGKRVPVTESDLKKPCEDLAENYMNGFRITWGCNGIIVNAHMNNSIWFEKGW
jgi:hypothetical protein